MFEKKIEKLANDMLENSGVYREYSDEDLANVVLIFNEVFLAKTYKANKGELTQKQLLKFAKEAGKSIYKIVKFCTKVDLHSVFKK